MTDLTGKSYDWLAGYHAAMAEVAGKALAVTKEKEREHAAARSSFFGGPGSGHYLALGGGRVSKEIGQFAFERGNAAFAARKGVR